MKESILANSIIKSINEMEVKEGNGSGNFGHVGRSGHRGGFASTPYQSLHRIADKTGSR